MKCGCPTDIPTSISNADSLKDYITRKSFKGRWALLVYQVLVLNANYSNKSEYTTISPTFS